MAARRVDGGLDAMLGDAPQGSVARGIHDAWGNIAAMALGALLALWIFLALFTTLFTNLNGIATAPTPPTAPCSTGWDSTMSAAASSRGSTSSRWGSSTSGW